MVAYHGDGFPTYTTSVMEIIHIVVVTTLIAEGHLALFLICNGITA